MEFLMPLVENKINMVQKDVMRNWETETKGKQTARIHVIIIDRVTQSRTHFHCKEEKDKVDYVLPRVRRDGTFITLLFMK